MTIKNLKKVLDDRMSYQIDKIANVENEKELDLILRNANSLFNFINNINSEIESMNNKKKQSKLTNEIMGLLRQNEEFMKTSLEAFESIYNK